MKVEDLMIGDWVLDTRINIPVQVNPFMAEMEVPEWEPIPLTPEILEKNGILYRKSSFYYIINDDKDLECTYYIRQVQEDWAIGIEIGAYDCSNFARIKHVHELQHALKLCGIDKEITL